MGKLKRIAALAFMFLIVSFVIVFVLENSGQIALVFLGWTTPQLSVSMYIVSALVVGMIIGFMLSWLARIRKSR